MRRMGIVVAVILAAAPCRADDRTECFEAYERSQKLRRANDLVSSRQELLRCEAKCIPRFARDCSRWRAEVEERLSIVVVVQAADADGKPLVIERLVVDGQPAEATDEPLSLLPGEHSIVAETSGGEAQTKVTLRVDEQARKIVLTPHVKEEAAIPFVPPRPIQAPLPEPETPSRVPAYVMAGGGAGAIVGGLVLVLLGNMERSRLESDCSPNCTHADADRVRAMWITGGALTIVGAGALVGAYLLWPKQPKHAASVSLDLGFGSVGLRGAL